MSVKYCIDVPDDYTGIFWEFLTQNFNVVLEKRQNSADGERLHVDLKILDSKLNDIEQGLPILGSPCLQLCPKVHLALLFVLN